jgi:hypothetical protein
VVTPLMAILTRGRYYLRRRSDGIPTPILDEDGNPSAERLRCHVTGYRFERPDMLASQPGPNGEIQYVSSLALTLDRSGRYLLPPDPDPVSGAEGKDSWWKNRSTPRVRS